MNPSLCAASALIPLMASLLFPGKVAPPELKRGPHGDAVFAGLIGDPRLDECSGLAASVSRPGLLWAINDDRGDREIYAIDESGAPAGHFLLDLKLRDAEDLAVTRWRGGSYLLVADMGDDVAKNPKDLPKTERRIHVLREPAADMKLDGSVVDVELTISFWLEPRDEDCEALAAHGRADGGLEILLLTKVAAEEGGHRTFHRLLVDPSGKPVAKTAEVMGTWVVPDPPGVSIPGGKPSWKGWSWYDYPNSPTAMDLSADGLTLVVATHTSLYLFERPADEAWDARLAAPTAYVPIPPMPQVEAVCFGLGGAKRIFVTTEGQPAPLFRLIAP